MKKQNAATNAERKLKLNKKTISNLAATVNKPANFWEVAPTVKGKCFTHRCNTF
jgi:hypothetical protein